jgi:hypothetical protein
MLWLAGGIGAATVIHHAGTALASPTWAIHLACGFVGLIVATGAFPTRS